MGEMEKANLVLRAVSFACGLPAEHLKGKSRTAHIVRARQAAMYLIRQETNLTLRETGQLLGGRSPATITHGYQKMAIGRNV